MAQQHINLGTPPGGTDGDTLRTAMQKTETNFNELYASTAAVAAGVAALATFKNLLINGDLRINQRNFAGGTLAANTYGYDRWRALGAAVSITSTASTITLNGTICQVIEAPNLAGQTVTVSAWNPSAAITVKLQPDATTATTATGVIPAGAGRQSVTLAVPATLIGNVFAIFSTAAVTTFDGSGKRGGLQIEIGAASTSFDQRNMAAELALCQRYCFAATLPSGGAFSAGVQYSATGALAHFNTPVQMRTFPTMSITGQGIGWAGDGTANASNPTIAGSWNAQFVLLFTISGATSGKAGFMAGKSGGTTLLILDAEL